MEISIVGAGYVGLSLAVLISQKFRVNLIDIDEKKISLINSKKSPIKDRDIDEYLTKKKLNLIALSETKKAFTNSQFLIVATPTNYDPNKGTFDTSSVEEVISAAIKVPIHHPKNTCYDIHNYKIYNSIRIYR